MISMLARAAVIAVVLLFSVIVVKADIFNLITTISGDSIGDDFYRIAKGSGDVNGDCYQDVLIGAANAEGGGLVKLFLGGTVFDTIPDIIFRQEGSSIFGACAIIGDVNDDGYDDILIGDSHRTTNYFFDGAAYLYYGGADMDTIPDMTFIGEYWYHCLGNVSGAGDVNGDGIDDWLINAPIDDIWVLGRIYLYYGGENPDSICDVYFEGGQGDGLGFDNPALGDINGDGYDDLIFGNWGTSSVEIHLGSSSMDTIPDLEWLAEWPNYFIIPISGIGDVNNDGFDDWMIQCSGDLNLFLGSTYPDTIPDLLFEPEPPCTGFRDQIIGGDINGDNIDDIIIGGYIGNSDFTGQVLGYEGGNGLDNQYDYFFDSEVELEMLGKTVGLVDIDGNGIFEVLSGASQSIPGGPDNWGPGRVWILTTQEVGIEPHAPPVLTPPMKFGLSAHPNPFNSEIVIRYDVPASSEITLAIYDLLGRETACLAAGFHSPGEYTTFWKPNGITPSGIYFAVLQINQAVHSQKLLYIK